jgi:hypothetical protein
MIDGQRCLRPRMIPMALSVGTAGRGKHALASPPTNADAVPQTPTPPDAEVLAKPVRWCFIAQCQQGVLREADACTQPGRLGALQLPTGLYSSHLTTCRRPRERGVLAARRPSYAVVRHAQLIRWRGLSAWSADGTWARMWCTLLSQLDAQGELEWAQAFLDGSFVPAKKGDLGPARRQLARAAKGGWWPVVTACRWGCTWTAPNPTRANGRKPPWRPCVSPSNAAARIPACRNWWRTTPMTAGNVASDYAREASSRPSQPLQAASSATRDAGAGAKSGRVNVSAAQSNAAWAGWTTAGDG